MGAPSECSVPAPAFSVAVGQGAALLQELEALFFFTQPWGLPQPSPGLLAVSHEHSESSPSPSSGAGVAEANPEPLRGSCHRTLHQVIALHLQQSLSRVWVRAAKMGTHPGFLIA